MLLLRTSWGLPGSGSALLVQLACPGERSQAAPASVVSLLLPPRQGVRLQGGAGQGGQGHGGAHGAASPAAGGHRALRAGRPAPGLLGKVSAAQRAGRPAAGACALLCVLARPPCRCPPLLACPPARIRHFFFSALSPAAAWAPLLLLCRQEDGSRVVLKRPIEEPASRTDKLAEAHEAAKVPGTA